MTDSCVGDVLSCVSPTCASNERAIVLLGPMGVGKTTIASALARDLGVMMIDSDDEIERCTGSTGREIAREMGTSALHELEATVLLAALDPAQESLRVVVAAAASVVDNAECVEVMAERAVVVALDAPDELVVERALTSEHRRSMDRAAMLELIERRRQGSREVADLVVMTDRPIGAVVADVVAYLDNAASLNF